MSSLGKIILKNLETIYPNINLNLDETTIDNILNKANLNKKNMNKNELVKIIKILKSHINTALENRERNRELNKKIFRDMNDEDTKLNNLKLDYIDNFNKLKEKELQNFQPKNTDILSVENRINQEKLINKTYNFIIDSLDRDTEKNPLPNNYNIIFSEDKKEEKGFVNMNLRNVVKIELVEIFLKKNLLNILENPFLIIEIEEMGDIYKSSNQEFNKTTYRISISDDRDPYIYIKLKNDECVKNFEYRREIPKIGIKIKDYKGELYNFEDEKKNVILNSFTLKITTEQKSLNNFFIQT